jgi:hypothetical protein
MKEELNLQEEKAANTSNLNTGEWQNKLLPLMKRMIIYLTLFFFIASFGQLIYLQVSINTAPAININQPLSLLQSVNNINQEEKQSVAKLEAIILLESNTMERRHHQANVLLMSSIWVRYLGFVTGMILAMIGAIFILGKLEQNEVSEIAGKTVQGEVSIKSASPGIILVVLGAALMIITIVMQDTIQVNDSPVYLQADANAFPSGGKPQIIIPRDSISQFQPQLSQSGKSEIKIKQVPPIPDQKQLQTKPEIFIPKPKDSAHFPKHV